MSEATTSLAQRAQRVLREQFGKEALSDVLHVLFLLALLAVCRPMFTSLIDAKTYEAPSVVGSLIESDIGVIIRGAQRRSPGVPRLLFLLLPTLAFWFAGRNLRWTDWKHGRALRVIVMVILVMLAWSGSTFDYNMYLDRGHFFDRFLLVGLAALSWRFPLAVPFATRLAIIMIKESYHPIPQDDFDYRPTAEVLVVFSVFAWASLKKSFKPKHFLLVALGAWASYYYLAGWAKLDYGPNHAWLYENHVTNLGMGGHIRGWLAFMPESWMVGFYGLATKLDRFLAYYVLAFELGALAACFVHPKLTRFWIGTAFLFHFGLFLLSGVCFWKWGVVCLGLFLWMGRSGKPILESMYRHKLVLIVGMLSVFYAGNRIWYFPQTGVKWFDTRFVSNYLIYAVGESGEKYLVDPNYFAPSDMHFVQGRLCYATHDRAITAIYGVTGSYTIMKRLQEADSPEVGMQLLRRGGMCGRSAKDKRRKAAFDQFMKRFWSNINRHGRPHGWLRWIGRPTHLHVHQQGNHYDMQERVKAIELWREPVFWQGGQLHRWPATKSYELKIE